MLRTMGLAIPREARAGVFDDLPSACEWVAAGVGGSRVPSAVDIRRAVTELRDAIADER